MCSKEKQFYEILKKYNVKDYWCSSEFNPKDKNPCGTIVFDENVMCGIDSEISDLFNDYDNDVLYVYIYMADKTTIKSYTMDKIYITV